MKHNPITLAHHSIPADVDEVIARYAPELLNAAQRATGLNRIRDIVRACDPQTAHEARTLFATASRYLADVAPESELDPDRWIAHDAVAEWAHAQLRANASVGTLSNRLILLRRMLRVLAGLPARMPRTTSGRQRAEALTAEDRLQLELAMTERPVPAASYIAAVGANLVASKAVGWSVVIDSNDEAWMVNGSERVAIVEVLVPLAKLHVGVVVTDQGWDLLRFASGRCEMDFNKSISLVTFAKLALQQQRPARDLIARHGLSRRAIEDSQAGVPATDPSTARKLLRGA